MSPHPAAGWISIWQDKYDKGWRGDKNAQGKAVDDKGNPLELQPAALLGAAIAQQHPGDAHFWPGVVLRKDTGAIVPRAPRINIDSLPALEAAGLEVRFGAIALDVDDKSTHKDHLPASPEWRERQLALLAKLPSALRSGMARYDTEGGYRLVWTLDHAPTIPEFIALLVLLVRQLRKWGIDPDEFRDFGRCYRLPDVVRDGKRQVLDGNGATPGLLRWTPMLPDFNEVLAVERKKYERKPRVERGDAAPRGPGSFDALAMVEAAGREIIGEKLMGAGGTLHVVSPCMCEREEGGTGCSVTIAESGAVGIVCKHATCDYSEHTMRPGEAWKLWRSRHESGYYTEDDTAGIVEWASGDWSCYARDTATTSTQAPATDQTIDVYKNVSTDEYEADTSTSAQEPTSAPESDQGAAAVRATTAIPAAAAVALPAAPKVDPLTRARAVLHDLPAAAHRSVAAAFAPDALAAALLCSMFDKGALAQCKADLRTIKGLSLQDWAGAIKDLRVAQAVQRKESAESLGIADHAELAGALIEHLRKKSGVDVVFDRGSLYTYASVTGVWQEVKPAEISRVIQSWSNKPTRDDVLRVSDTTVKGVTSLACDLPAGDHGEGFFGEAPKGIAFANGFVQVTADGFAVLPCSPDNRQVYALPYAYDPNAQAPRWHRFLDEVFALDGPEAPEKARLLAQFAGACLLGLATKYQKALVLLGNGANGKSVFMDVLSALFPKSARAAIPPQRFGHEYYRAQMAGIRFNAIGEMPEADVLDGDALKGVIDGTPMNGRHPHGRLIDFVPEAGILAATNKLFSTNDKSDGFWRRWLVVVFGRKFAESEWTLRLQDIIIASEMPGVARWALEGAQDLIACGQYAVPVSSAQRLAAWRADADPTTLFVNDCLTRVCAVGSSVPKTQVYIRYGAWMTLNGFKSHLTMPQLNQRLLALDIQEVRATVMSWQVGLVADWAQKGPDAATASSGGAKRA